MNEYVIHARLKNNLLLSRILSVSKNVHRFCLRYKVNQCSVGLLINLKSPALNGKGSWTKMALRLAEIFVVPPEELFDEEQRVLRLRSNEAFIELSRQTALLYADPIKKLEDTDLVEKLLASGLTPREEKVLRLRFGVGNEEGPMSLEDVGKCYGVTGQRIRDIEKRAIRKLRHPSRLIPALAPELDYDQFQESVKQGLFREVLS